MTVETFTRNLYIGGTVHFINIFKNTIKDTAKTTITLTHIAFKYDPIRNVLIYTLVIILFFMECHVIIVAFVFQASISRTGL